MAENNKLDEVKKEFLHKPVQTVQYLSVVRQYHIFDVVQFLCLGLSLLHLLSAFNVNHLVTSGLAKCWIKLT